jgi:hypothetical protein
LPLASKIFLSKNATLFRLGGMYAGLLATADHKVYRLLFSKASSNFGSNPVLTLQGSDRERAHRIDRLEMSRRNPTLDLNKDRNVTASPLLQQLGNSQAAGQNEAEGELLFPSNYQDALKNKEKAKHGRP